MVVGGNKYLLLLKVKSGPMGNYGGRILNNLSEFPQDVYLTGNPQITFFKIVYRRHTNFAVESIEQYFNGTTNFGKKSTCEISRNGDLIVETYLRVALPEVKYSGDFTRFGHVEFAWVRRLGHAIIDEVELEIGGSQIDKQYGEWLNIWYEVSHKVGHETGYAKMIGDIPELTSVSTLSWDNPEGNVLKPAYTMYIPLQFYFCRNNGLALPLIALQYHQVKIYVTYRDVRECIVASDAFLQQGLGDVDLEDSSLFVNYVYLDTEERRRFAQVSHEYLIEQLQFTGEESINSSNSIKAKLNFNHPCKALYWVTKLGNYQGKKFMIYDHCDWERARENAAKLLLLSQYDLDEFGFFNEVVVNDGSEGYTQGGIDYVGINPADPAEEPKYVFNDSATAEFYADGTNLVGRLAPGQVLLKRARASSVDLRDKVEGVIRIFTDFENDGLHYPEVERITRNDLTILDLSVPIEKYETDNRCEYVTRFDVTVWQHHNYGLLIDGTRNPVTDVLLQLNGQDRQSKRSGFWYDTVEPYQRHCNTPVDGLNVFSFALNPEEHQPSCTCNFSRIDTAQLNLTFAELAGRDNSDVFQDGDNKVMIFATNYNVLRVLSGMAGLAYSN